MKTLLVLISIFTSFVRYSADDFLVNDREKEVTKIMQAIRIVESTDNYSAVGLSGEYGAYQFTEERWGKLCDKYHGKCLNITLKENQDHIARCWINDMICEYTLAEIASIWNCNSPEWEGKEGINNLGVAYNTPAHVQKFILVYKSINKHSHG